MKQPLLWILIVLLALPVMANSWPEGGKPRLSEDGCTAEDFLTEMTAQQIQAYYERRHRVDGFNGSVLVAKNGLAIYSGAFGYGNINVKDTLTTQSSFQLASVSKTFTSSAVLKLVEEGKIALTDTLQKFFPEFPYPGITVKLLLSHRSGLPEYIYWGKEIVGSESQFINNQKLLDLIVAKKPPLMGKPDKMFKYCNTNYALLALIVEKVSGVTYKEYMDVNIFQPLGMTHTFVCALEDTETRCGATCYEGRCWREWKVGFSDGVVGDKGIYSSVEDMLKWDNALKEGKVISSEMLEQAYTPRSLDRYSFGKDKSRNYGYGWRMAKQRDGSYLIYHNGNWHGCNNVFARNLKDGYTIIVLGNKANNANYNTVPVWAIIQGLKNSVDNIAVSTEE